MSHAYQIIAGTLLLLGAPALLVYAFFALSGMPYAIGGVTVWLSLVEYAAGRAWWTDAQELMALRRSRT